MPRAELPQGTGAKPPEKKPAAHSSVPTWGAEQVPHASQPWSPTPPDAVYHAPSPSLHEALTRKPEPVIPPEMFSSEKPKLDISMLSAPYGVFPQNGFNVPSRSEMEAEQAKQAAALQRTEREQALRTSQPGQEPASGHAPVERMTQAEYDALTPQQRAAVDFNTMLVRAVRTDRKQQEHYHPTEQQKSSYNVAADRMFGEAPASDFYAPETLAVLRQIDFKDTTAKLEDFTNLQAAITEKDLANIDLSPKAQQSQPFGVLAKVEATGSSEQPANTQPAELDRLDLSRQLAQHTMQMQDVLTRSNEMLATMQATAAVDRNDDVSRFGGYESQPTSAPGYGQAQFDQSGMPANMEAYFQFQYDKLADRSSKTTYDEVLADLVHNVGASPSEIEAFNNYLDTRSGNAARYGLALGNTEGVNYRKPEQFRQLLGLDAGGR